MSTLNEYLDNIDCAASEGRLIQGTWHRKDDGKRLVCLLTAVADGVDSADSCPSEIGPLWLRTILVPCHDSIAADQIVPMAHKLTAALRQSAGLTDAQWDGVLKAWLGLVVKRSKHAVDVAHYATADDAADAAAAAAADAARYATDAASYAAARRAAWLGVYNDLINCIGEAK